MAVAKDYMWGLVGYLNDPTQHANESKIVSLLEVIFMSKVDAQESLLKARIKTSKFKGEFGDLSSTQWRQVILSQWRKLVMPELVAAITKIKHTSDVKDRGPLMRELQQNIRRSMVPQEMISSIEEDGAGPLDEELGEEDQNQSETEPGFLRRSMGVAGRGAAVAGGAVAMSLMKHTTLLGGIVKGTMGAVGMLKAARGAGSGRSSGGFLGKLFGANKSASGKGSRVSARQTDFTPREESLEGGGVIDVLKRIEENTAKLLEKFGGDPAKSKKSIGDLLKGVIGWAGSFLGKMFKPLTLILSTLSTLLPGIVTAMNGILGRMGLALLKNVAKTAAATVARALPVAVPAIVTGAVVAGGAYLINEAAKPENGLGASLSKDAGDVKDRRTAVQKKRESTLEKQARSAGITDPKELAAFMGQMSHESGRFKHMRELSYSPEGVWKARGKTLSKFGVTKNEVMSNKGDTAKMFEYMYADKYRDKSYQMGNTAEGDAYKYRGRGFTQLTGKDNYAAMDKKLGLNGALLKNPELAEDPEIAAKIAVEFWKSAKFKGKSASEMAKAGDTEGVTQSINSGLTGLDDRKLQTSIYEKKYTGQPPVTIQAVKPAEVAPPTPGFVSAQIQGPIGDVPTPSAEFVKYNKSLANQQAPAAVNAKKPTAKAAALTPIEAPKESAQASGSPTLVNAPAAPAQGPTTTGRVSTTNQESSLLAQLKESGNVMFPQFG